MATMINPKFKVGDKVRPTRGAGCQCWGSAYLIIEELRGGPVDWYYRYQGYDNDGKKTISCFICYDDSSLELISTNTTSKFMATLKEKFVMAFKSEPEKSFIKAGIITQDESLTSEGQLIFLSWLLKKNGEDFKKEVVDPILKEEEKK